MNKELEEAIKTCNEMIKENKRTIKILQGTLKSKTEEEYLQGQINAIETILNYIDNSVSKEVIKEYLRQEQEAFNTYKKESKENENLKMGMWKHLGAKNMCERILGIERNIVTLD